MIWKGQASGDSPVEYRILHAYPESQVTESKWLGCLAHAVDPAHYASPAFFKELYFEDRRPFVGTGHHGRGSRRSVDRIA